MLSDVHITNWKGHEKIELSFGKGVNFITGPNGTGKTSILDAISYAFLGTIEFMGSYHGIDHRNLIRDRKKDSEIHLSFSVPDGKQYEITRRIGTSRRASMKADGKIVATSWQAVTNKVLEIYKASDVFLGRCVFLTEGETYQYVNRPPGEGLATHIQSVLGIDSMENLESVFNTLSRKYSDMSKRLRSEVARAQIVTKDDKIALAHLSEEIKSLADEQQTASNRILKLSKEHDVLLSQVESLQNARVVITEIMDEWQKHFTLFTDRQDPTQVLKDIHKQIENEHKTLVTKRHELYTDIGKLLALTKSQGAIIDMLQEPFPVGKKRICPVCKRPLTEHMVVQIGDECRQIIVRSEKQLSELEKQSKDIESAIEDNRKKLDIVVGLQSKIRDILKYGLETITSVEVDKRIASLRKKADAIPRDIDRFNGQVTKLNSQLIELKAKQQRIQEKVAPERIDALESSLLSATKIEFLSRAFLESVEDSLTKQRSIMLAPLMDELSTMWSRFMNTPVKVQMGDRCELAIIDDRYDTPFKFPQLSGGEKTALLILTHILLCKHFSDSDFMLLDEPLEHLDSRNRWALVNFLLQSCKREAPAQLIVTTIEEQYTREYLDESLVTVTRLG